MRRGGVADALYLLWIELRFLGGVKGEDEMEQSVGQALQSWLMNNTMSVEHDLFVAAVDHAFQNECRRLGLKPDQSPETRRDTSSIPTLPLDVSGSALASIAT